MLPYIGMASNPIIKQGKSRTHRRKKRESVVRLSLYFFIYLTIMNLFSVSTAVILHEFGHFATGIFYNCEGRIVIFEIGGEGPYTELQCPEQAYGDIISLGGFLLIIPFGLIFLIFRNHPIRNFSLVIIGLGFILSGLDLLAIYESLIIFYATLVLGGIIIISGERFLVNEYMNQIERKRQMIF